MDAQRTSNTDGNALDQIAGTLSEWREEAGDPSYGEIARRVGELRGSGIEPGRSTVYDCFRAGRRRIDVELTVDIARALGVAEVDIPEWRARCFAAMYPTRRESSVVVAQGRPVTARPFIRRFDGVQIGGHLLLSGMPGVGKTQAANDIAGRLLDRGDAVDVLTLGLRGATESAPPTAGGVVDAAANVLGIRGSGSITERAVMLGERLRAERFMLVVDDVTSADQVEAILPALRGVPVVMTSRIAINLTGVSRLAIAPWTGDEVLSLFEGIIGSSRIANESTAAARIAEHAGGVPLAAAVIAARVRDATGWALEDVAEDLDERSPTALHDGVEASIAATYAALDSDARRMLRLVALQPCASLSTPQLASLTGLDESTSSRAIARLEAASLAIRGANGRVWLHDLVRAFASERARDEDPPRLRHAALDRLATRMIGEAWGVAAWREGGTRTAISRSGTEPIPLTEDEAQGWARTSGGAAVELMLARAERRPEHLIELAQAATASIGEWGGQYALAYDLNARAAIAAREIGDPVGEARSDFQAAVSGIRIGRADTLERLERAAEIAGREDQRQLGTYVTNTLATLAAQRGDLREALEQFRRTLENATATGDERLVTMVHGNLSIVLRRLGELEAAARHGELAIEYPLAMGHSDQAARAMTNFCEILVLLGRFNEAAETADRALEVASRGANSPTTRSSALTCLGEVAHSRGAYAEAVRFHERAIELHELGVGPDITADACASLGHSLLALGGSDDRATAAFERALELGEGLSLPTGRALHGLALLTATPAEAHALFERALELLAPGSPDAARVRADMLRQQTRR